MIPKVIHYCWFGGKPLPEKALECIGSWKRFLPGYEIKEWNESNFDINAIPYTREAYKLKKYAFVSDYARFWILYNYGGIYFDTDVELIKPIDDILERGAFMGNENWKSGDLLAPNSGLGIAAPAGMPFYKIVLEYYENNHYISLLGKIKCQTVVSLVKSLMEQVGYSVHPENKDWLICEGIIIYPSDFFSPMNYYDRKLNITDNTRSIHHYHATWVNHGQETTIDKILDRFRRISVRVLANRMKR